MMVKVLFQLHHPIEWRGKIFNPGKESQLRMRGWPVHELRKAIKNGTVSYPIKGIEFYQGPYYERFWDLGLFTDLEIERALAQNRILWGIKDNIRNRVFDYLDKQREENG